MNEKREEAEYREIPSETVRLQEFQKTAEEDIKKIKSDIEKLQAFKSEHEGMYKIIKPIWSIFLLVLGAVLKYLWDNVKN